MKIAEAGKESHAGADLSMRVDLQQLAGKLDNMKTGLLSKLSELLQPITEKLEQMSISIQNMVKIAER